MKKMVMDIDLTIDEGLLGIVVALVIYNRLK